MDDRAPLIPVDQRQSRDAGATSETPIDPGTQLGGQYEVLDRIGPGGMGEVYRALDTRLDRIVAVKVLRADSPDPSTWRTRFEREARAVSNLNHPHICALYDIQLTGDPTLLAQRVALNSAMGRASFTASQNGVLAYHAIGPPELVWVNRTGRQTGLLDVHDFDANPAISPSGASVAFAAIDANT